jgi:hypothetical protein
VRARASVCAVGTGWSATPELNYFKPATTAPLRPTHCALFDDPATYRDAPRFLTNCEFLRSIPLNQSQDKAGGCEKYFWALFKSTMSQHCISSGYWWRSHGNRTQNSGDLFLYLLLYLCFLSLFPTDILQNYIQAASRVRARGTRLRAP